MKDQKKKSEAQCEAIVNRIHTSAIDLTCLPLKLQTEIHYIGTLCRGSVEHIWYAMLTLMAYAFGAGARIRALGADGDNLEGKPNMITLIVQGSGAGKSVVAGWVHKVMKRLAEKIKQLLATEAGNVARSRKVKLLYQQ